MNDLQISKILKCKLLEIENKFLEIGEIYESILKGSHPFVADLASSEIQI